MGVSKQISPSPTENGHLTGELRSDAEEKQTVRTQYLRSGTEWLATRHRPDRASMESLGNR
jgi:hypothetical protein